MKWGILATGTIARKFASTICAMEGEGEVLLACASRDGEKARAFAGEYSIPRAYGSYEELLLDPEVEAVYIATPNHLHGENTRACLLSGKHVLCEKPFTTSAAEAEELYALSSKTGCFLMEALWIRFLPLYAKLREIIASGACGPVCHARCEYGFIAQGARRERKFRSELGGGALLDIGIYNLSFLHMVMGESPSRFQSEVTLNEYGTDSFSSILFSYPGGRTAQSVQTIGLSIERRAAVHLEKASIYLPDFQGAVEMTVKPLEGEAYTVRCPADINGFEYQIREVSRCVREGRTCSELFPPADSLAVLRLMDEIRASWNLRFSFE